MERLHQHQETVKHVVDAVAVPGGVLAAIATITPYLEAMNLLLAFGVLLTSLIWGIYRITDMRNSQRRSKRVKNPPPED